MSRPPLELSPLKLSAVRLRLDLPGPARLGLAAAAAFTLLLGASQMIAAPVHRGARLRAVAAQAAAAQAIAARGSAGPFADGAVCEGAAAAASAQLNARLQNTAQAAGLTLARADITDGGDTPDGRLEAIGVSLDATGPYEAVVGFLNMLDQARPTLFLDAVDIDGGAGAGAARLTLQGRVLCRT